MAEPLRFEKSVELPCSREKAWELWSEWSHWKEWASNFHPLDREDIPKEKGEPFWVTSRFYLAKVLPWTVKLKVKLLEYQKGKKLVWEGRLMGLYGRHGFEFESIGPQACRLVQWEEVYGAFASLLVRMTGVWASLKRAFERYNRDLKNYITHQLLEGEVKTVQAGGVRWAYREGGAGETVVLLHGYPESHLTWRKQFNSLAQNYRVIAPDFPGWGKSEKKPDLDYSYEAEIERLGLFFEALNLDDFNLFAHDYGGFIGLGYGLKNPGKIRRLALLNTRGHRSFRFRWMAGFYFSKIFFYLPFASHFLPLYSLHWHFLKGELKRGCFNSQILEEYLGHLKETPGRRWLIDFFRKGYDFSPVKWLEERMDEIHCPTSIIWGKKDRFISFQTAKELARGIPRASLVEIDGDHYVMEEAPQKVYQGLVELLGRE